MSSPFDAGRDSNAASGTSFNDAPDVSDTHLGAARASFDNYTTDNLGEQDYRSPEHKP